MTAAYQKIMIKRLALFSLLATLVVGVSIAIAQEESPTESPSSSPTITDEKVKSLKQKLATKVAELRESQTRGFYGEIAALTKSSFTLDTAKGEIKIRFNEDTKIETDDGEAKIEDIKNNAAVSVMGLFEPETKQLTAKIIILLSHPEYLTGELTQLDKDEAVLTLKQTDGTTVTIDYEKTTQAQEYQAGNKVGKSGLSRLTVGDRIHAWVTISEEDNERFKGVRILRIAQSVFEPEAAASPETSPTNSPKSSPKPTPKASPEE